jgi:hypothetical protein
MSSLVQMRSYSQDMWLKLVDDILVRKFDEEYD